MANGKFIAYYRVSTARQGQSGLGLEAQQESVRAHLQTASGQLVGQFEEVETGKGADALNRRPQLKAALDDCKRLGATLIIAKLDRLAGCGNTQQPSPRPSGVMRYQRSTSTT